MNTEREITLEPLSSRVARQQATVARRAIKRAAETSYWEAYDQAIKAGADEKTAREAGWAARELAMVTMKKELQADEGRAERIDARLRAAGVVVADKWGEK